MSEHNYRLYSLANFYISPLAAGLQTAHVVSELHNISADTTDTTAYDVWAREDKTIIILNGGNHAGIVNASLIMERAAKELGVETAIFYEDEQSLNGAATATAIVLPEPIWGARKVAYNSGTGNEVLFVYDSEHGPVQYASGPVYDLLVLINSCRLF